MTHSLGIGGDSEVRMAQKGGLRIGPVRRGRPMAMGGPAPTPTDAMITLDLLETGNRDFAKTAMEELGRSSGWDAATTAQRVLKHMAETIAESVKAFIDDINSRPVYTIHEVVEDQKN